MNDPRELSATVLVSRAEFDRISQLLEVVQSQSEMIARLTRERNERIYREAVARQQRETVFRIPKRP